MIGRVTQQDGLTGVSRSCLFVAAIMLCCGASIRSAIAREAERLEFNRDIRPLLADRCFSCHGPDANSREADLRLDQREAVMAAGILADEAEDSELWQRIVSEDDDYRMPPASSNKRPLGLRERERIKRWIQQGANYDVHWSLIPPRRPSIPAVHAASWCINPIDRFVLARQERNQVAPSPAADRVTLIRRLYFDLAGMPPAPAAVDAFVSDLRPDAYRSVVERLLASPRFGERMAIYWLDLVRFANSVGYHGDQEHPIDPYRDYVIASFNDNLSFDQFTVEQLAGDLLPNPTTDQLIASGYNRLLQTSHEGGVQKDEYLAKYAADRVRNLSAAWMGATLGCAECHDHKFDPYSQRDFYQLAAFFADVDDLQTFRGSNTTPTERYPEMTVLSRVDRDLRSRLQRQLLQLEKQNPSLRQSELVKQLQNRIEQLNRRAVRTMVTKAIEPRRTRVFERGDWMDETGELVDPGVPHVLPELPVTDRPATRLDLARWLTHADNPQTARVFANRAWYLIFGVGISRNLEDMGVQGEWPTHPELLDWLACELVDSGWDVKHLIRQMVMSNTYRQSSIPSPEQRMSDPDNRLFTRAQRFRLPAELIRDTVLSVSGLLVLDGSGRAAKPRQPVGYYAHLNFPTREYVADQDSNQYRRGVYMHWQRQFLHPMLKAFDAPSREECTAQRTQSNTPQAALTLLNDPCLLEAAVAFAGRSMRQAGPADADRISWIWRQALSRLPTPAEQDVVASLLTRNRQFYQQHADAARELVAATAGEYQAQELAAWTSVARVVLNLNEVMSRN